jgi:hypothetical protein
MLNRLFRNGNKHKEFWDWFTKHSDDFFHLNEENYDFLFTKLNKQLSKVNRDLTYEFSAELIDGNREFIISADGIYSAFPDVIQLVETAPEINDFKIIAFRQRGNDFNIQYNEVELDPANVFFSYLVQDHHIDIILYIKGYDPNNQDWEGAAFILLDTLIGEYDVVTKIGEIDFRPFQENFDNKPVTELPNLVDNI